MPANSDTENGTGAGGDIGGAGEGAGGVPLTNVAAMANARTGVRIPADAARGTRRCTRASRGARDKPTREREAACGRRVKTL